MSHLSFFGGAVLDAGAGPVTGRAAQRHRVALLALLSTTRRLYRSRDQLIALLWPETDAERGRKLLSDSIYRINRALSGCVIASVGDDVRLDRDLLVSDVATFEAAIESRDWRQAASLYTGPFLDGFFLPGAPEFDHWMENERGQYARSAAKAVEALATQARDAGQWTQAVEWWQRLAALVPDDSRVAIELMRALETAGNRAGALRHATAHTSFLREAFGLEPDCSVLEIADQIAARNDVIVLADHPPVAPGLGDVAPASSIAVLPFNNMSTSDVNACFADGISEELTNLLARTPGLRVASRTSAFAYRDLALDVRDVARRLNVAWILEGSVRRWGNALRIVARLIDAKLGFQVWSESFDRTSTDVFGIQAEIAGAIASRLAGTVGGTIGATLTPRSLAAVNAASHYELYL